MLSLGPGGTPDPLLMMYLLQQQGQNGQSQSMDPGQLAMLSQLSHRSGLPSLIGRINQTLPGPNPDGSAGYYGGGAGILGNVSKAGHTLADIIGSPNQMLAGPQQSGQAGYMGGGSGLLGFLSGILSGNG